MSLHLQYKLWYNTRVKGVKVKMQEYFKIGEISRLYGIGVDSLRYYEEIGLLQPVRSESGYRLYSIREIWKLNIIRDLRELDFSMEQIGRYLKNHSLATTLSLLREEDQAIGEKIQALQKLKSNVEKRIGSIESAVSRPLDTIALETLGERRCYSIAEGYSEEHEMDVLIKRLLNMDRSRLYLIGNSQIGTVISLDTLKKSGKLRYESVYVIDENGTDLLPGGTYLTVTYRGDYRRSRDWAEKLLSYARDHQIRLAGDLLETLLVDIHISADKKEHITQLQVLTC